ncbi:M55 family metallopeptidase [Streptomyces sp. NPDC088846]|uniref:M55 family metallopeptidase n=1 Tax=Streptomyces sp. NPDC088846 TaxID=3365908 RepID=UPI00381F0423
MEHEIEAMWLDGRPVGEVGPAHATAAALGVPVAVLTGDDRACEEMTAWDTSATTVAVKYARDRFAAELRPRAPASPGSTPPPAPTTRSASASATLADHDFGDPLPPDRGSRPPARGP